MNTALFSLESPNGVLRGKKIIVSGDAPIVVLACGHNGFYHYGMFPTLQDGLAQEGFSSVAFNYSHSGISADGEVFDQLDRYALNCRRLEKEDLLFLIKTIREGQLFGSGEQITVLAHSMGGVPAAFAVDQLQDQQHPIAALALLCSMKTLNVRTPEIMQEWQENGIYFRNNPRTKQDLPQGNEFLQETLASTTTWNVEMVMRHLNMPVFVAHSVEDESVPFEHGRSLFSWCYKNNTKNAFLPIPGAGHTLNTAHPMKRDSEALQFFLKNFTDWLKNLDSARNFIA